MNTHKKTVTVYIDGFNLYHGLKSQYKNKYLWLNLLELSKKLIRSPQELVKVKYFTSLTLRHTI